MAINAFGQMADGAVRGLPPKHSRRFIKGQHDTMNKSPSKESCTWGFRKESMLYTPRQEGLPVVFSGEPLAVSTVPDTQQGPHKYPLHD